MAMPAELAPIPVPDIYWPDVFAAAKADPHTYRHAWGASALALLANVAQAALALSDSDVGHLNAPFGLGPVVAVRDKAFTDLRNVRNFGRANWPAR